MRSPALSLQFIVPLRAQTGFRERFLTDVGDHGLRALRYVSQREQRLPPELRTRYRGALRDWELTDPETGETRRFRVAYIHSSEEHRETAAARERALTKAEEQLQHVKNGLGGRYYKTRKQVEKRIARIIAPNIEGLISTTTATRNGKPTLTFTRNQEAIAAAARTDGIYALATNLPGTRLTAGQILRDYKGQQIVERRHRDYKQTLKVRPIFLHNDDRIYALTSIIGIALLIFGLIETELRKALGADELIPGLLPENRAAKPTGRNVLSVFQGLGLTYTHAGIELDRLTHTQRRVLELLHITPPWPEQRPADLTLSQRGKWGCESGARRARGHRRNDVLPAAPPDAQLRRPRPVIGHRCRPAELAHVAAENTDRRAPAITVDMMRIRPLPRLVLSVLDGRSGQTGFVEDRDQGWSSPVLIAQAREVLAELVVHVGGLRCGLRALEDPCGGAVRAAVGAFELLVGEPLVDGERVGRVVSFAALGEAQPQV